MIVIKLATKWLRRTMNGISLMLGIGTIAITVSVLMGVRGVIQGFEWHLVTGIHLVMGDWLVESMFNQDHRNRGMSQLLSIKGIQSAEPIYIGSAILLINGSFQVVPILGTHSNRFKYPVLPTAASPRASYSTVLISQGLKERLAIQCPAWAIVQTPFIQQNKRVLLAQSVPLPPIADWGMMITTPSNAVALTGGLGTWGIQVRARHPHHLSQIQIQIERTLGRGWVIQNWQDRYPQLAKTLLMTRQVGVIITLLVGCLGGVCLAMVMGGLVQRHHTSIAILRLNGITSFQIAMAILITTALVSGIGCVMGSALGWAVFWLLRGYLPFECVWLGQDWIGVVGCWMGCLLFGMWPAWRSTRVDPGIIIK